MAYRVSLGDRDKHCHRRILPDYFQEEKMVIGMLDGRGLSGGSGEN